MKSKSKSHTRQKSSSEGLNPTLAAQVRVLRPDWTWNQVKDAIKIGRVLVDGVVIEDSAYRPLLSNKIELLDSPSKLRSPKEPLAQIYFSDQHLVVVEKPSGQESVPFETRENKDTSRQNKLTSSTLIESLKRQLDHEEGRKNPPLRIVHRLDKGTSGVMMFARTVLAERHLGAQFKQHSIDRSYLAVVSGHLTSETISSILVKDRGDGLRGSLSMAAPKTLQSQGKNAITHIKVMDKSTSHSLIECTLETGRTHQIRIHLCEHGNPLCGDQVYRKPKMNAQKIADNSGANRLMLHAQILGFTHPVTQERCVFKSSMTESFLREWQKIKQKN